MDGIRNCIGEETDSTCQMENKITFKSLCLIRISIVRKWIFVFVFLYSLNQLNSLTRSRSHSADIWVELEYSKKIKYLNPNGRANNMFYFEFFFRSNIGWCERSKGLNRYVCVNKTMQNMLAKRYWALSVCVCECVYVCSFA